jgi:hypothetical protein
MLQFKISLACGRGLDTVRSSKGTSMTIIPYWPLPQALFLKEVEMAIDLKKLERYIDVRNVVTIRLKKSLESLPYLYKGIHVLPENSLMWLAGNPIETTIGVDPFPSEWEDNINPTWRTELLIGLHNNRGNYTSTWNRKKKKSECALFFVRLSDILKHCEFESIGKILDEKEFIELFEKHEVEIKTKMTKEFKGFIIDGKFDQNRFDQLGEMLYYDHIWDVLLKKEKIDISTVGLVGNTFNVIQHTGLKLLGNVCGDFNINKEVIEDMGIVMF